GLAAAHATGLIHRDVKPSNIFVGRDGRVRVGDFGLARFGSAEIEERAPATRAAAASSQIATNYAVGTPAYMAPEQVSGAAEPRSDQFSLCVSLVEALTGNLYTRGDEPVFEDRPRLRDALLRGMREDPEARFPMIDAFADALADAIAPPPPRRRGT